MAAVVIVVIVVVVLVVVVVVAAAARWITGRRVVVTCCEKGWVRSRRARHQDGGHACLVSAYMYGIANNGGARAVREA